MIARKNLPARRAKTPADAEGQMTVEWALVLAAVVLPMYFVLVLCVKLLVAHFQMVSFLETLPFP